MKILEVDYAHFHTSKHWSSVDKQRNPIPWYTYPAIDYLKQLDFSDKQIFEYGCGNSTLFWGFRAKSVTSVEDDEAWYHKMVKQILRNTMLNLVTDKAAYIRQILGEKEGFDVIVIDGSHRYECAREAVKKLKHGGMIILDNSDWYVKTAKFLRESNLIQVDMTGFGPIVPFTSTTSFYFHREFNFRPLNANQPEHGIGSLRRYAQE